jgi:hypothetical protein
MPYLILAILVFMIIVLLYLPYRRDIWAAYQLAVTTTLISLVHKFEFMLSITRPNIRIFLEQSFNFINVIT